MVINLRSLIMNTQRLKSLPIPRILHKSEHFLCVDKPFDLKINSNDDSEITVESKMRKAYPELADPKCRHGFRFVHRLDFATSGILCLGLTKLATKELSHMFKHRHVTKYYLALVRGHVPDKFIFIDVPTGDLIDEDWKGRCCTVDHPQCHDARFTHTLLVCMNRGLFDSQPATKVLLKPFTGRTHQLRVHCNHLGHTIVGDYTYSLRQDTKPIRMMLHAHRLHCNLDLEPLDITAPDPFVTEEIAEWTEGEECVKYEDAVNFAEQFEPDSKDDRVKIVTWDDGLQQSDRRTEKT